MDAPKPFVIELEQELKKLHDELSIRRKKADDVKIAELLFMKIKAKIVWANVTNEEKDITNAHNAIDAVWRELGKDYKRKTNEDKADMLISDLKREYASGNKEKGKLAYLELRQIYPTLNQEKKKEVAQVIAGIK